ATLDRYAFERLRLLRSVDAETNELGFQTLRTVHARARAVRLARALRLGGRRTKRSPGAGRLTELLVAVGEVEQRANARIDALAVFELLAGGLVLPLLQQCDAFVEQRLCCGLVGSARLRHGRRAAQHAQHEQQQNER